MQKYEKLTHSTITIRKKLGTDGTPNIFRIVQFRVQEDTFNNSEHGSMPILSLFFNGDISSPAILQLLSADARNIGRALIDAADRMEAAFVVANANAWEEKNPRMGLEPEAHELYRS